MTSRYLAMSCCLVCGVALMTAFRTPSVAEDPALTPQLQTAQGYVYHDVNQNQVYDAADRPLPGVRVSNGRQVTLTDGHGRYELPVDQDAILFVIKPRNWMTPLDERQLPRFFYIHKPHGSPRLKFSGVAPTGALPEHVNFPLYPHQEPEQFRAILFGDPQPRNVREVEYIAHDVVEELIGADASFGVTLGDIVFDDLKVFEPLNQAIALIGIPWYNVLGNHDINFDARTRRMANETFESIYGPSYYSFEHGPVHFIVLDNIEWLIDDETGKGRYRGGLGPEQVQFVKNDLALIPEDQMVVILMHIPLDDVHDRHGLYRLIEQRPFCISISGHTHTHEHRFITHEDGWRGPEPHHHIVNVTVSGSWWSGAPDERGIPHTMMADGAPNGYSIISFDGTDYTLDFKAAGRDAAYQMHIDAPEELTVSEAAGTTVFVNVFNSSARSMVRLRCGGSDWVDMVHDIRVDPHFQRVHDAEARILEQDKAWRALPKPKASTHLWTTKLPSELPIGTHLIEVETTDQFGRTFIGQRVIRIAPDASATSATATE